MTLARLTLLTVLSVALGACGGDRMSEIGLGLATATATGRAAALSLDAVAGGSAAACVQVSKACTTYPCDGAATLNLGPDCGLPLGGAVTGTVNLSGQWTSANKATFLAEFINVKASEQEVLAVARVKLISVEKSGNTITVKYVGTNAEARAGVSGDTVGGSSSWTVVIDTKGTPEATDDVLTIDSTSASAAAGLGASAKAATFKDVVVSPECSRNPISGSGQITEVQTFVPSIDKITFHADCDGKALLNGSPQPLRFFP